MARVVVRVVGVDGSETEMKFTVARSTLLACKKIVELYLEKAFQGTVKEITIKVIQ